MLQITTMEGTTITGKTRIELAAKLAIMNSATSGNKANHRSLTTV